MTHLEQIERSSRALKVFPLPSAVLFPNTLMPLHIFEPRYRDLVRDALETDRVMALAALQPGFENTYAGRPPLRTFACAGVIAFHETLEGGRANLLLQGVVRVRLGEELPALHTYREVRAQVLPDPPFEGESEQRLRQAILDLATRLPPALGQVLLQAAAHAKGAALADTVASAVVPDVRRRQELLEELDPRRRLDQVMLEVGQVVGELSPVKPAGPMN